MAIILVLLSGIALIALIDGSASWLVRIVGGELNGRAEAFIRLLLGVVALVGAVGLWFAWIYRRHQQKDPDGPLVRQLSDHQISSLLTPAHSTVELKKSMQIYMGLLFSSDELEHAHETYTVHREVTRRIVIKRFTPVEAINKKDRIDSYPVPIATIRKGYLPNNFSIVARDGTALPTMAYGKVLILQLNVLEALIHAAFGDVDDRLERIEASESREPALEFKDVVRSARRHIAKYGAEGLESPGDSSVETTLRDLRRFPLNGPSGTEGLRRLEKFLRTYTDAYPLVADVPRLLLQHPLEIRFSEDVPLTASLEDWRDRLRMRLGLGPYKFNFPLFMHELADSYHLVVQAAPASYLFSQQIQDDKGTPLRVQEVCEKAEQGRQEWEAYTYMRLQHRHGLPYSHLYARGFGRRPTGPDGLTLQVRFHERPPGALGTATLLAGSLVAFISGIGWVMSEHSSLGAATDLPALLLVLPGLVALLFGQDLRSATLATASLTARVGFLSTLVLSLLAILLYVGQATGRIVHSSVELSVLGIPVPITDLAWLVLACLSLLIFFYLLFSFVLRTITYERRTVEAERTGHREKLGADAS